MAVIPAKAGIHEHDVDNLKHQLDKKVILDSRLRGNDVELSMSDPDDIRGWQRLDARTTTSGKLLDGDPARLAGIGVQHVINLALDNHPEALADEGAKLAAAGIGYTHIPVPFDAPTEAHFDAFRAALNAIGDTPVHVHCIANYRVSAFYYRLNRDDRGMDEAQARALMEVQWQPDKSGRPETKVWAAFIK